MFLHSGWLTSPDMQQQLWREVKPQVFTSTQSNHTKFSPPNASSVTLIGLIENELTSVAHYTDFKSRPF